MFPKKITRRGLSWGWAGLLLCLLVFVGSAHADTIVLSDGAVIEGTIVSKTEKYIKIDTDVGGRTVRKTFRLSEVSDVIKESMEGSALSAIQSMHSFAELDDTAKRLKNAEALYALGRFKEIPEYVEPLMGKGTKFDEMRVRWLLIETYERQARWDEVQELLDKTEEDGREPDKIRAKAHKAIFKENPGYTLRKIGGRRAKEFLSREMWIAGKDPDALADGKMMRAALVEYIDQILRDDKLSLYKFQENLDLKDTMEAIEKQMERGSVTVVRELPYREELQKVQNTLYRANAVLPGYVDGYELELVRIEVEHLSDAVIQLFNRAFEAYPEGMNLPTEGDSNRLTPEARRQWQEATDRFLDQGRPLMEMLEYMLTRARTYPKKLAEFIERFEDIQERLEQLMQSAVRNRDRATI